MNARHWFVIAAWGCLMVGRPCFGAEDWNGKRIIPKSGYLLLRENGRLVDSVFGVQWPAVVKNVDGLWLWVEDAGGVRQPPAAGWVRSEEVLLLTNAFDYFNRRLADDRNDGSLLWLRAICWENSHEFGLAAKDYSEALRLAPNNPDARLGLARVLAKSKYDEKKFQDAWQLNQASPRLYVDWGQALESGDHPAAAEAMYRTARRLAPNWRLPHYLLGHLAAGQEKYSQAVDYFNESLRHDQSNYLAYRDRAAAMLQGTPTPEAVAQALASARKACELCYFREAESVSTLAQSFAALEQWTPARRFEEIAVEYAPVPMKSKHKRRWRDYALKCQGEEQQLLAEDTPRGMHVESPAINRDVNELPALPREAIEAGPRQVPRIRIPHFIDRSAQSFQ